VTCRRACWLCPVGTGLQVMAAMVNAKLEAVRGPRGQYDENWTATRHAARAARPPSVGVGCPSRACEPPTRGPTR
jgi:shikimate kinase